VRPIPNQSVPSINSQQPVRPSNLIQNSNGGSVAQHPQPPGSGLARASSSGQIVRPPEGGPAVIAGRVLNQPNRTGLPTPASPSRLGKPLSSDDGESAGLPPPGKGFYSARAAAMVPDTTSGDALPLNQNLPVFNPHLESPSIRKTPGVDHKSSKPLTKDLKHVPGSSQTPVGPGPRPGMGRGSVINPQLDAARQIGAPSGRAMSPLQNRGSYKPPTIKRPLDADGGSASRMPLATLPANGPVIAGDDGGGDVKRQRINS
jgi:DNA repair and recombination protein RAD52